MLKNEAGGDEKHLFFFLLGLTVVKNAGLTEIFSVFLQLTTYTTLMHASTGTVETYIRFCKDPCFPW